MMQLSPREQREEYFNRLHHHGDWGARINLWALWRKWQDKKRARKKAELLAHQEAYAHALHYRPLKPPLQKSVEEGRPDGRSET